MSTSKMADEAAQMELKKKRTFRKFMFRGVDLDQLLDLSSEQLMEIVHARAEDETDGPDEEAAQGEERGAPEREAGGGEDAPAQHDRAAGHDREHHRHPQREDVQPGRD